jgi:hypothetical protein
VKLFSYKIVKLYIKLCKVKSLVITQIYIKYIRLAAFLNKTWVLEFLLLVYLYSQTREIVMYIIIYYKRFVKCKRRLTNLHTKQLNIKKLISKFESI